MPTQTKNSISARRVVLTSFIVDTSDFVLNIIVAIFSGSVVMLSQALQGGADMLTSALLVVGLKQSQRRANRSYGFGYGRELFFWILMAGISTFVLTATLSFYFGLQRLLNPEPVDHLGWSLLVLFIGLVTNIYALNLSYRRLRQSLPDSNRWKSVMTSPLIESKATLILDLMGAVAAILGLVALGIYAYTGDSRFDGLGAMVVGLATGFLAILLISEVKDLIVGRSAPSEIEAMIKKITHSVPGVHKVLDLKTMFIGSEKLLINIEIHVQQHLNTAQIEALTDRVKDTLKRDLPIEAHIQVEIETPGA